VSRELGGILTWNRPKRLYSPSSTPGSFQKTSKKPPGALCAQGNFLETFWKLLGQVYLTSWNVFWKLSKDGVGNVFAKYLESGLCGKCQLQVKEYMDLPDGSIQSVENNPSWYDCYKKFCEEAELTMQNVLVLWGVAAQKNFDSDSLDSIESGNLLDDFLKLTDYEPFLNRMRAYKQAEQTGMPPMDNGMPIHLPRPMTPHTRQKTQQRLAELDMELAQLDSKRNALIAERRRLIGCEVEPVTTSCLKLELEARRWREDVGFD
jgi:hypothetical protein